MDSKRLEITLIPSPDDSPEDHEEYQAQLRALDGSLREQGFEPPSSGLQLQAAGQGIAPYLSIVTVAVSGSLSALSVALGAWLKGRYGRAVELEIDGVRAKAGTMKEVRALLEIAQDFKERNQPKKIIP